jgi:hypothetical protein
MKHLGVALVVPVEARVPLTPTGAVGPVPETRAFVLEQDAADLAKHPVAVTLQVSVPTLEALSRGSAQERGAVSALGQSLLAGDELLPSTSFPVNVGSLVSSGLMGELQEQLSSGDAALTSLLGEAPSPNTWVFDGPVNLAALDALAGFGVDQVALPETALSTLPSEYLRLTFAQPSKLEAGSAYIEVLGADSEMSKRISQASAPGQAVLVAEQVLAELAMIDLEAPNDERGIVLLPSHGTTIDPTFLSELLSGLQGNPLLQAMTLSEEFASVPLATVSGTQVLVRQLQSATAEPLGGSSGLHAAQAAVAGAADVYGPTSRLVTGLDNQLSVSTSSFWTSRQRAQIIKDVRNAALSELHKLHLPPPASITLTSRHGRLPLTLLSSAGARARVLLVLSSEELSFVSATFPVGSCAPLNPGSEQCRLDLDRATTTLQVPVVVRTPGAFQLALKIETPGGAVVTTGTDTIRSTAVSGVGLLLMVGAALFLAVWWVRNARHGRRARKLVPPPSDEYLDGGDLDGLPAGLNEGQPGPVGHGARGAAQRSTRAGPGRPRRRLPPELRPGRRLCRSRQRRSRYGQARHRCASAPL